MADKDKEKDRRSKMVTSTVNAPAKKGGAGGQYTWGKAEDVTDYEPVGTQNASKVSSAPLVESAVARSASETQPPVPDRRDTQHFPTLGTGTQNESKASTGPKKESTVVQSASATQNLTFYIFGSPVKMSPSPDIHNPGFAKNAFSHTYDRCETDKVSEVMKVLRSQKCGGGSVTIPHKESILKEMDELGDAARCIGAVNTVTKLPHGKFRGDNTDWLGIKNLVEARLASSSSKRSAAGSTCLLCGAGGTARAAAYAFQKMGAHEVFIYNRTTTRAVTLAQEFGFRVCEDMAQVAGLHHVDVVVNTLPGSTGFTLPEAAAGMLARCRPVVLEATYIPRRTPFLKQALAAGCVVIEGIEMLYEQGCEQCEIWTGRPAPRADIARSLASALFCDDSPHPARTMMEPIGELPWVLSEQLSSGKASSGRDHSLRSPMVFGVIAAAAVAIAAFALRKRV